jgi:hypothetical protein
MVRADRPATPSEDLEARRNWAGPVIAGVLTEDLARFCQSGVSVVLGTRADGLPLAGVALACIVNPSGKIRILLREPANTALLRAFESGAGIAATFTEPRTHRSIQLKAVSARQVAATEQDLVSVARQIAIFKSELESAGYSAELTSHYSAYRPDEIVAIEFTPREAFVQTPGPGAGSALKR